MKELINLRDQVIELSLDNEVDLLCRKSQYRQGKQTAYKEVLIRIESIINQLKQ